MLPAEIVIVWLAATAPVMSWYTAELRECPRGGSGGGLIGGTAESSLDVFCCHTLAVYYSIAQTTNDRWILDLFQASLMIIHMILFAVQGI